MTSSLSLLLFIWAIAAVLMLAGVGFGFLLKKKRLLGHAFVGAMVGAGLSVGVFGTAAIYKLISFKKQTEVFEERLGHIVLVLAIFAILVLLGSAAGGAIGLARGLRRRKAAAGDVPKEAGNQA